MSHQHDGAECHTTSTQTLCILPEGEACFFRSDSMSAVTQVNHHGSTRSARLLREATSLCTWAGPYLAALRAVHLPGEQNPVADFLSWHKPPRGEWQLHPEVVDGIWEHFGGAEVDLFALTHCPLWFSWTEESNPLAHSWPRMLLYAFPPLIWLKLQRALRQGHKLLLVDSFWPERIWFPLLHKLCCGSPWRLPGRKDLLSQLVGQAPRPGLPLPVGLASVGPDSCLSECSDSVRDTILNARAPCTRVEFENRWWMFSHWCASRHVDPVHCSVASFSLAVDISIPL